MLGKMLDRGPVSININIHIVLYFHLRSFYVY